MDYFLFNFSGVQFHYTMSLIFFGSTISIHAPSRERPNQQLHRQGRQHFNPRSLTGATPEPCKGQTLRGFQSTLPHGSDWRTSCATFRCCFSIHAPSRERLTACTIGAAEHVFNPRSLTGATRGVIFAASNTALFQSTLPRGSDLEGFTELINRNYFNPRSLAGATSHKTTIIIRRCISIHAPSRERRGQYNKVHEIALISIHAPSRERLLLIILLSILHYFNPRSLAGATS